MQFAEYRFEDLPSLVAENNRLLSAVKVFLEVATMPQKVESDLLNVHETSVMLGLSIATIYTKVCKKELPYTKFGKRIFFSKTELQNIINRGRVLTKAEVSVEVLQKAALAMKGGC